MAIQRFGSSPAAGDAQALTAHQHADLWLDKGAAIRVLDGAAQLGLPPAWLAEQVVWTRIALREGERHVATRAGWHQLAATGASLWFCHEPAPSLRRLAWQWAVRLQGGLRKWAPMPSATEKARTGRA